MNQLNLAATRLWLAIEQPSADPGPFGDVWTKLGGVLFWVCTIGGLCAVAWGAVMLAWERINPAAEQKSGLTIILAIVGGVIAAGAANIINWAYGS